MDGLFIGFWVEKCATRQSHRKSDFGWITFSHLSLPNAYYKEGSKKSQAILLAFRSYILTGKPELFLYWMCFFFWFPKVEHTFLPLVYALDRDLTYNSIRFDISLSLSGSDSSDCKFGAWQKWEPVRLAVYIGDFGNFLSFSIRAHNYYPAYHIGTYFSD